MPEMLVLNSQSTDVATSELTPGMKLKDKEVLKWKVA